MTTDVINLDGMQRFTATGRPYKKEPISGLANGLGDFTWPQPHLCPRKFTDADTIPVPIRVPRNPTDPPRRKSFLKKLLFPNDDGTDVVVKQMTRGEYLKHYAKDEEGNYIGMEEPAEDCMLKEGDRRAKHGEGVQVGHWSNEITMQETKKEKKRWMRNGGDSVIR